MCEASNLGAPLKSLWEDTQDGLFGKQKASPDPEKERLKAETEAANSANTDIAFNALRKRKAAGKVSSESVLAGGALDPTDSTVLGSGGR